MWLYTKFGFYSVVHKPPCKCGELLVRARCIDDLKELQTILEKKFQFSGKIIETPKADYAFRMIVPRQTWGEFLASTAMTLDYNNFKDSIPQRDHARHQAFFTCWEAMFTWQKALSSDS